jgi:hypothetical protein
VRGVGGGEERRIRLGGTRCVRAARWWLVCASMWTRYEAGTRRLVAQRRFWTGSARWGLPGTPSVGVDSELRVKSPEDCGWGECPGKDRGLAVGGRVASD